LNVALFAAGFACGAFLVALVALIAVIALCGAVWRFSRAVERAGFDIHLNEPKVIEPGS
jgi:hypothetical protein